MHAQWSPPCVRAMQCGKQCACGARCTVRMQYARAVSRIFCLSSPGATQRRRAPCDRVHHLRCRRLGVGAAGACERRVRRWERQHRQPVRCRRGAVRGPVVRIGLGQRGGGGQQKAGVNGCSCCCYPQTRASRRRSRVGQGGAVTLHPHRANQPPRTATRHRPRAPAARAPGACHASRWRRTHIL